MKWFVRILAVAIVVGLGWLFLSPPTLRLEVTGASLSCRPLGWEMPAEVTLAKDPSDREATIERYLQETGPWADASDPLTDQQIRDLNAETIAGATDDADALCGEARQNRQTTLLLGSAASLALLVWWRTRRTTPESTIDRSTSPDKEI